jgi:hypothetical protein
MNQHVKILTYLGLKLPQKPGDALLCLAPEFSSGRLKYKLRRPSKRELRAMRVLEGRPDLQVLLTV